MITLHGSYADECNGRLADRELRFVCRAFLYDDRYFDGVGRELHIEDGDVLLVAGHGSWFALFHSDQPAFAPANGS